jgi:integrase/recombinase XerD
MDDTQITTQDKLQRLKSMVIDGLQSERTKQAYSAALTDFLDWYVFSKQTGLNKAVVQAYKAFLLDNHTGGINIRLSAIRKFALEAEDNGLIDPALVEGIRRVEGVKQTGQKTGNWLTLKQAEKLINTPNITHLKGMRDRAVLAVLIGCGLRREEAARLAIEQIQLRDARWVIVDLMGKGNKIRTVPVPAWVKVTLDAWFEMAGITAGRAFRALNRHGQLVGDSITPQGIFDLVVEHSTQAGCPVAPHDLRRTFAKLARKAGSELTQIQLSLGHANVETTQRYVAENQDLTDAPGDRIRVHLSAD